MRKQMNQPKVVGKVKSQSNIIVYNMPALQKKRCDEVVRVTPPRQHSANDHSVTDFQ